MSLNSNFQKLKYLIDSGINSFIQDIASPLYEQKEFKIKKRNKISDIQNLAELEAFTKESNICSLKKDAKKTVFSDGNPLSKIMLIGEAPGADEDKYGKPFVGKAGQLLDKMLGAIELDRNNVYISNVVPWRPPNNRQPTTEEILQCLPIIQRHIELIKPLILILLGTTATKALLATNIGITKLRGTWHQYNSLGLSKPVITRAIFHPAFLLRSPDYKKQTWEDLLQIKKHIKLNEVK